MIAQVGGYWWPESDVRARPVILRDVDESVARILSHIEGRDLIVQAGANVGIYPLALADFFQRVVTAEPDPENADCLFRNLLARDSLHRVYAHRAAFGEHIGDCKIFEVEAGNCGAHRIIPDKGALAMITIDSLALPACDAIWLDCEGYELQILRGAVDTIFRYFPTIACEEKGLGEVYGNSGSEIFDMLSAIGYSRIDKIGRDSVYKRLG